MNMKKNKKSDKENKGSFLLELLVAFAVISIAMTVIVDAFITSQRSYRLIADQTNLTRSLSVVLEDMSKEGKVSESYGCGASSSPCSGNIFSMVHIEGLNNQNAGESVRYTLGTGANEGKIMKMTTAGGAVTTPMTPPSIVVTDFNIKALGSGLDQVIVFMTFKAHTTENPTMEISLQTSFTQRIH